MPTIFTLSPLHLVTVSTLLLPLPAFAQEPTSQPTTQSAYPTGELLKCSYTAPPTSLFPGTTRDYWIYIPAQYDPTKSPEGACLFVDQDKVQFNANKVFDQLIASHEMPITIGIFVAPGILKPLDEKSALPRFNRSYEFDSLSPDYAKFLLTELLPDAQKQHASDGRAIILSQNPDDRMIAGSSSGAIAAFTVAWERPDSFHRVFSAIGTFVDLRTGNNYPSLIRKFEPKPLRIFLQDGSNDHNHYGGDWWMANQEMERALTFAGYEVNHIYGTGGHEHNQANAIFPDAIRWLWKDYPAPIKPGPGSEQLQQLLLPPTDPNSGWQTVSSKFHNTDGPAPSATGDLLFNDGTQTYTIDSAGNLHDSFKTTAKKAGSAISPDGRFITAAGDQLLSFDLAHPDAPPITLAENLRGNDLAITHSGDIYITESFTKPTDVHKLWLLKPKRDGSYEKSLADTGLKDPDGVCLSPDHSLLYLNDYRSHWVYSFQIQPDGTLADKQKFFDLYVPDAFDDAACDGMRTDTDGRLYVSTRSGIQVCDQAGRVLAIIPTPNGKCSNLAFAGKDFSTLYVTAGNTLYKRQLKTHGPNPASPPIKPAPPKL